jgi:hypothetical protein
MNESVHQLVQSLLQKNSIDECNLQDLQNIAKQFPYFAPIQLILAEKMKSLHPSLYQKQLQKTSLYFHNPLWFEYLLNREEYPHDESITTMPVEEPEQTEPFADDLTDEQIINKDEWITLEENGEETIQEYSVSGDHEQPETMKVPDESQINPSDDLVRGERIENTEGTGPESAKEEANFFDKDDSAKEVESFILAEGSQSDVQLDDYGEGPIDKKRVANTGENGKEEINFSQETTTEQDPELPSGSVERINEDESRGIQQDFKMPGLKQEIQSESETVLAFEPYHTIDYFASQGIKLSVEEKPGDRLGLQLKSFTDWLKTMKKLPQSEISKNMDSGLEQKVQTLAEHSLETREVVTEAMAEVWEKQGNREKAIETYNKLSFLIPAKSAYFAGKIEQLKKEN